MNDTSPDKTPDTSDLSLRQAQIYAKELNVLFQEERKRRQELEEEKRRLEQRIRELMALNALFQEQQAKMFQIQQSYGWLEAILQEVVATLDARDPGRQGHSTRVAQLASDLASRIGLTDEGLPLAARLHDIGYILIPDGILLRRDSLSPAEEAVFKQHPLIGDTILQAAGLPLEVRLTVRHHHENYDGSGYPDGLAGEQIGLSARLIAVIEAYEEMSTWRPYRPPLSREQSMLKLREGAGIQYDPFIVKSLGEILG
ncbi:MAG: HD domain-containing protein [Chloroflexi bacterium]|nr:HD domain-containing protein [Chloroflexota bacterium]